MDNVIKIYMPRRFAIMYAFLAVMLIPWIFSLASNLPSHHIARHWDALWVGFDIMLLLIILLNVIFIIKRSIWVIVSASALAMLLFVDVWFDVLTARPGREQKEAFFFGAIELFLALLTLRIVYHVIHNHTPQKTYKIYSKK